GEEMDAVIEIVLVCVAVSQVSELALQVDADTAYARHAPRQAARRRPHPAAEIDHRLALFRRAGGGEQDRIDRDAIAQRRLMQRDAPAKHAVESRLGRWRVVHERPTG